MRTASRVGSIGSRARGGLRGRGRWAAAAVLAAAMLSIPADRLWEARHAERAAAPTVARAVPAAFAEPELPTVEGVNRPGARVYNMDGEGMSVVMIVDESLDV